MNQTNVSMRKDGCHSSVPSEVKTSLNHQCYRSFKFPSKIKKKSKTIIHVKIRPSSFSNNRINSKHAISNNPSTHMKSKSSKALSNDINSIHTNNIGCSSYTSSKSSNITWKKNDLNRNLQKANNKRLNELGDANDYHQYIKNNKKKICSQRCIVIAIVCSILLVTVIIATILINLLPKNKIISINNTPILRWNTTGITVAGITNISGTANYLLNGPYDILLDSLNTLYISDQYDHRIQKWMPGASYGTVIAGDPNGVAGSTLNRFIFPSDIVMDSNGGIYVIELGNNRATYWALGASTGIVVAGNGTSGSANNQLSGPRGIARDDSTGTLYIADTDNHRIMKYQVGSLNGTLVAGGLGPGTNVTQLSSPFAVYFDLLSNSLFIANFDANNIVRWELGATQWTLVAGSISGASGITSTRFTLPGYLTFDILGNMYVADTYNYRVQFFLPNQSNGTTIAGIVRVAGANASLFNGVISIALDTQLNMYIADFYNHRIQKFFRY